MTTRPVTSLLRDLFVMVLVAGVAGCSDETGGAGGGGSGGAETASGSGSGGGDGGHGGESSCPPTVVPNADQDVCFSNSLCDQFLVGDGVEGICTNGCERDDQCAAPARCSINDFGTGSCLLPCGTECASPLMCDGEFCNLP